MPEPARAITVAGLATLSEPPPVLVAVPTTADAERLAHDLGAVPRPRRGRRCSRRGRRCRSSGSAPASRPWAAACAPSGACATPERRPAVVVAPVRALVQRLGPHVDDVEPLVVAPGRAARPRRARRPAGRAPATGASTRSSTGARSPCAARSSTSSRPPPTRPVRIDLWGDEVDRLTEFSRHRPALHRRPRPSVELFPCRELLPTDDVRARAAALVGDRAVGPRAVGAPGRGPAPSTAWSRGCRGSPTTSACCSTSSPADAPGPAGRAPPPARPGRRHPRRGGRPGRAAGPHLGASADDRELPAPAPRRSTGCSPTPTAPVWTVTVAPDGPDVATVAGHRLEPRGRRRRRARPTSSRDAARRRATASWSPPTATGSGRARSTRPRLRRATASTGADGASVVAPLERGRHPARRQAGGARRGRPHRPPPGPPPAPGPAARDAAGLLRRPQARRLRRAPPARRRPLRRHGQAGHRRRRARLPAARVPGRRQALRPVRPDRRRPPLHRRRHARRCSKLGGGDWHKTKAKVRRPRSARSPRSWSCSTRRGVHSPGPRLRRRTRRGSASWRRRSPSRRRPTRLKAIDEVKADMEADAPDGPPGLRRRRLRQDRGRHPGRVQGGAGRQAGGGARAHHAAGPAALPDLQRPLRRLPGPGRGAVAASSPPARPRRWSTGVRDRRGRRRRSAPTGCCREDIAVQGPRPAGGRRGAALRRHATRSRSSSSRPTSTCSRSRPRRSRARSR